MKKRIYNQTALFGPLYAYLVVLSPPQTVKDSIAGIKKELNAITGITDRNLHSIAHITLTDKLTDDTGFADTIKTLAADARPFPVTVEGWGYFDHGQSVTIYLTIKDAQPIINLMSALKSPSKSPHVSLAKKIPHNDFKKLTPYLEKMDFKAEWVCSEINVLRKLMSEKHLGFRESFIISLEPG
jgi:2'-5' RNA ligase